MTDDSTTSSVAFLTSQPGAIESLQALLNHQRAVTTVRLAGVF